jgi:hypothetical protein
MTPAADETMFDWKRGGAAAAGAFLAVLVLLAMVVSRRRLERATQSGA